MAHAIDFLAPRFVTQVPRYLYMVNLPGIPTYSVSFLLQAALSDLAVGIIPVHCAGLPCIRSLLRLTAYALISHLDRAYMEYRPGDLLEIADESDPSSSDKRSLLILNQPLEDFKTFRGIWHQASNWICADGGANRLYELFSAGSFQDRPLFVRAQITVSHDLD